MVMLQVGAKNTENVFISMNLLNNICKYFAINPYSLERTKTKIYAKFNCTKIYYMALVIMILILTVSDVYHYEKTFLRSVQARFCAQSANLCLIMVYLKRKLITKMLNGIDDIDKQLTLFGYVPNYTKIRRISIALIAANVGFSIAMMLRYFLVYSQGNLQIVVIYYIGGLILTFYYTQFLCFAIILNEKIQFLCAAMEKNARTDLSKRVNTFRCIYKNIWKHTKFLNANYNVVLLLIFVHCFINSTNAIYFWLGKLMEPTFFNLYEAILWIIFNLGRLVIMAAVGNSSKVQVSPQFLFYYLALSFKSKKK